MNNRIALRKRQLLAENSGIQQPELTNWLRFTESKAFDEQLLGSE
jgi:hypothetical protein